MKKEVNRKKEFYKLLSDFEALNNYSNEVIKNLKRGKRNINDLELLKISINAQKKIVSKISMLCVVMDLKPSKYNDQNIESGKTIIDGRKYTYLYKNDNNNK